MNFLLPRPFSHPAKSQPRLYVHWTLALAHNLRCFQENIILCAINLLLPSYLFMLPTKISTEIFPQSTPVFFFAFSSVNWNETRSAKKKTTKKKTKHRKHSTAKSGISLNSTYLTFYCNRSFTRIINPQNVYICITYYNMITARDPVGMVVNLSTPSTMVI